MSQPVLGVIPARLGSRRLPRKPLQPIAGRPLLEWVWRRVSGMPLFQNVVIATDAPEVEELCLSLGARVVMTDEEHPSGTDRVAQVARLPEFSAFPIVVNVQGDEPLIEEGHLRAAVALVREGWEVGTCACPLGSEEAHGDPSVVKVVRRSDGGALYFSRAAIPHRRDAPPSADELDAPPFLRHVGVYAYRRESLVRWVALPPSPLEELERLEQLRALEAGLRIGVAIVDGAHPGVDTAADVVRMEELISRREDILTLTEGP